MIADPAEVVGAKTGAGNDVEAVLGKAGDGEVGLDAAAVVEQLGVGDATGRMGHVIGADQRQSTACRGTGELEFGKGALVEQPDGIAHRAVLLADGSEPVLPTHRGYVLGIGASRGE